MFESQTSSNSLFGSYQTLTQQQFDLYSGYWKVAVNLDNNSLLKACFLNGKATHVGYSASQISLLVSTVGAHSIEARFVCDIPSATDPEFSIFGVVLYAADRCGNRLSAYYLAAGTGQIPPLNSDTPSATPDNSDLEKLVSAGEAQGAVQIPHYLAASWIQNWKCIWNKDSKGGCTGVVGAGEGAKPSMFITSSGTLQGYSFNIGDLSQSLFNAQPVKGIEHYMLFNFCLHEYYALDAPDTPGYTFGLVIRLYNTDGSVTPKRPGTTLRLSRGAMTAAGEAGGGGGSNEPFYDMSYPRPPYGPTGD